MLLSEIFLTLFFPSVLRASLVATAVRPRSPQIPSHQIFQFDNGTWIENIAVRSNGNLLVTLVDRPELYHVDPFHNTATLLANLEDEANAISLLGITEMAPDVFVFVAGNFSVARSAPDPASYSVWQIDLNHDAKCRKISEIARLPEASFLNGMTALDRREGTVLISDSVRGVVWRLNIRTGKYEVVLEDVTMKPIQDAPLILGINGIRIFQDYVYYVNAIKGLFCRTRIDLSTGKASGPYEILAADVFGDDFAMSNNGVAFITENGQNSLVRVDADRTRSVVAGGLHSTLIAGATSAAFGRTWMDQNILYVTAAGGQAAPVNGTYIEGGKIVAVYVENA
jgi:sugar lactone lactonase YvrE